MEKLRGDVVTAIRSCLISTKGRVSLRQLSRDFSTLMGERIPYSKFGFNKLEDFIQSEPSLILSKDNTGEYYVAAKASEKSAHISEMVSQQKSGKKKPAPRVRFNMAPARPSKWRPRDVNVKYKGPNKAPSRLAAVEHNQIIKHSKSHNVPSKVVVPAHSTLSDRLPKKMSITTNVTTNGRTVALNGHNNESNNTRMTTNHTAPTRKTNEETSGSEMLTKRRIAQKVSILEKMEENTRTTSGSELMTKRRITQKMEQLSLEKENHDSLNFDMPLPYPSPVFKSQPVLSRNNSTGSGFSIDSNHSAASTSRSSSSASSVVQNDNVPLPSPSKTPEFVRGGNALEDLKEFVKLHRLGQVEPSSKLFKTKKNRFWTCKIKISEKHAYGSYPNEFDTPIAAENYCAEIALDDLVSKYSRRKSLLLSSDRDILERIPPMLEKHHHGIWASQLRLDYADKYNEELPDDWLKIVDTVTTVQIDMCSNDHILQHCKPGDKGQRRSGLEIPDVSVPSNTVHFGSDNKIFAQITNFVSANEIWCKQFMSEESDLYNNMMGRLEIFYSGRESSLKAGVIKEAGYYIAKYDNSFQRVRALKDDGLEVNCFFIDFGFEAFIAKEDIFELRREFAAAQAQAFVCRLVGLEELYEVSALPDSLEHYTYREVTLELATDAPAPDCTDITTPVYMYDYKLGHSINEELIPIIAIASASPVLKPETITEVYISNIETNGDVYCQLHSYGYDVLQQLLTSVESQINENQVKHLLKPVTKSESQDKIYLAQDPCDPEHRWRRAKMIDWSPTGDHAQIYFIDFGNTHVIQVAMEPLYPLEGLSEVLNQYPPQAVKTRIALDVLPDNFKPLAEKAMPVGLPVLLKIVKEAETPLVEFFTRNTDGGLFCINKSMSTEMELRKGGDGNNNLKSVKQSLVQFDSNKNLPSAGSLKQPILPNKKDLFEVKVPFAVNPYNFFVQPLESNEALNNLMEQLQERYKDVHYSPLQLDQIVPGNIYASKHDDGFWYRTSVIKVIHSGSISVFYCDFGYYANLTLQKLIPLDIEFMDLPYQALKAKLSGIKPKQSKWTMDDCESFKQLVEKKNFYSMLLEIEYDVLYDSDIVLKLLLIDTSGSDDIYIDQLLCSRDIAVRE